MFAFVERTALFKDKDFGRTHLDDRLWLDRDVFGILGMTTWSVARPAAQVST